jgi:hypothetical protein
MSEQETKKSSELIYWREINQDLTKKTQAGLEEQASFDFVQEPAPKRNKYDETPLVKKRRK